MSWTKSGTVSVTNGSAVVYGAGTTWSSASLVRSGDIFKAPDGRDYEVLTVQSNTQLTLTSPYLSTTASAQAYALIHTGLLPAELAIDISDLQSKYLTTVSQLYEWETSTAATVPITNPATGVTQQVKPLARFLSSLGDGSLPGSFTSLSAIVKAVAPIFEASGPDSATVFSSLNSTASGMCDFVVLHDGGHIKLGANRGNLKLLSAGVVSATLSASGLSVTGNIIATGSASLGSATISGDVQLNAPAGFFYSNGGSGGAVNSGVYFDGAGKTLRGYTNGSEQFRLDASGNLLVGTTSGNFHALYKNVTRDAGNAVAAFGNNIKPSLGVYSTTWDFLSANSANAAVKTGKDGVTGRSIASPGTINASGADYAEYERNNGLTIDKGAVVGFKADGTLTQVFDDAIRFGVKSTNPSYVGGDTWGSEDVVGKRPEQPQRKMPVTEQHLVSDAVAASSEVLDDEGNTISEAIPAIEAVYETIVTEAGDTDDEWEAKEAQYQADLADFTARLEAERQKVDRIAYSGKVPVNVNGATPGGYIIAAEGDDGEIVGQFIADPDFAQYKRAVGRVNRILEDGRAEIAVMVH